MEEKVWKIDITFEKVDFSVCYGRESRLECVISLNTEHFLLCKTNTTKIIKSLLAQLIIKHEMDKNSFENLREDLRNRMSMSFFDEKTKKKYQKNP